MRITVLAGGIGGARFLRGVRVACPDDELTAVINTGDDVTLHGLRITPDLDSCMYTLGEVHDHERGCSPHRIQMNRTERYFVFAGDACHVLEILRRRLWSHRGIFRVPGVVVPHA